MAVLALTVPRISTAESWPLWQDGRARCHLVLPATDERAARLAQTTFARHLREFYKVELPVTNIVESGTYLVLGTPENNPAFAKLVNAGVKLTNQDLGSEGFQLLTHEDRKSKYVIAYAKTPRALKHACQELIFYRVSATATNGFVEAPLNVVMKPELEYRGIYMLPCWSAHDSFESWERVLRFNSELTLNRNWFWLDGFPIAGHTGEYPNTDLANAAKVQRLLDLANAEEIKIYIGGGWFNWHHEKAVGKHYDKGVTYYLDYLKAFTNFHGFYIEPTGEGSEIKNWRPEGDALCTLIREVLRQRPDFEFAVAIGKFNNAEYLKQMSELDPQRVFWWWCWGDPIRDQALDLYPSVLRWHLSQKMSEYHGSLEPPAAGERRLTGIVTSYDPGQGFGNPWNGWGKLGVDQPRNFHPHTLPYFAQQYFYRERCWNLNLTEAEFLARLLRRLFDAGAPKDAAVHYWRLSQFAQQAVRKKIPPPAELTAIREFITHLRAKKSTPRMVDTLSRMEETLEELTKIQGKETTR
ncbi:MAG TPA: hypothetical protein VFA77_16795 [Candidatus Eisenbacteria bacterium]|nr:hypothetical protein [Candidatus Eisenbacteria bacterium]